MSFRVRKSVDKHRVVESFRTSGNSYDDHARVQKEVAVQLLRELEGSGHKRFRTALEIGCGTGLLTRELLQRFRIESLYLNDIVKEFCDFAGRKVSGSGVSLTCLPGDIENTTLPENVDLVISSSTLQWVQDLPRTMGKLADSLSEGGMLALALFSNGTMAEVRALTGQGLCYHSSDEIAAMLPGNCHIQKVYTRNQTLWFARGRDVLRHIRYTGVAGVSPRTNRRIRLKEFEARYEELFGGRQGVPVTYVSTILVAQKRLE